MLSSAIIHKIWIPDIIIQNAKTTALHSTLSDNFMMKIGGKGEMEYSVKMSSTPSIKSVGFNILFVLNIVD